MTGVFIKKRNLDTDTHTEKMLCDFCHVSYGAIAKNLQKLGGSPGTGNSLPSSEGAWLCQHLHFEFPASL